MTITIKTAEQLSALLTKLETVARHGEKHNLITDAEYLAIRGVIRELYSYDKLGLTIEDAPLMIGGRGLEVVLKVLENYDS